MRRAALLCSLCLLAAAPVAAEDMPGMDMHNKEMHGATGTPADKAFAAAMARMMAAMDVKPTGDADRDFVRMMIPHHQGAIDMARVELAHGKDPILRKLAEDIVKAQETEIADMKAWLGRHPK